MSRGLAIANRGLGIISYVMMLIGAAVIGMMALVILVDITGRTFFDSPFRGTVEIVRSLIVAVAFLTIPYAVRASGHLRTTVVLDRIHPYAAIALTSLSYLLGALLFGIIALSGWDSFTAALERGDFVGDGGRRVPTWPTWLTLVIASAVTAIECLVKMVPSQQANEGKEHFVD